MKGTIVKKIAKRLTRSLTVGNISYSKDDEKYSKKGDEQKETKCDIKSETDEQLKVEERQMLRRQNAEQQLKDISKICSKLIVLFGESHTQTKNTKEIDKEINVPGPSEKVVKLTGEPVGPCATKTGQYKNAEYYSYHKYSFYEAMVELKTCRLPVPSNVKPSDPKEISSKNNKPSEKTPSCTPPTTKC